MEKFAGFLSLAASSALAAIFAIMFPTWMGVAIIGIPLAASIGFAAGKTMGQIEMLNKVIRWLRVYELQWSGESLEAVKWLSSALLRGEQDLSIEPTTGDNVVSLKVVGQPAPAADPPPA